MLSMHIGHFLATWALHLWMTYEGRQTDRDTHTHTHTHTHTQVLVDDIRGQTDGQTDTRIHRQKKILRASH